MTEKIASFQKNQKDIGVLSYTNGKISFEGDSKESIFILSTAVTRPYRDNVKVLDVSIYEVPTLVIFFANKRYTWRSRGPIDNKAKRFFRDFCSFLTELYGETTYNKILGKGW